MQRVESILSDWRGWLPGCASPPKLVRELPGGRTNHSYLIHCDGRDAVLRINAEESESLGIDRRREEILHRQAASAGLSPPLLYCDPDYRFSVTEYVSGRQWRAADIAGETGRQRIRELVARVQALPVLFPSRDYVAYVEKYWSLLQSRKPGVLSALRERRQQILPVIASLQEDAWKPVVVHHDLYPENIIERNGCLFLLDWEYAACGHPDIDRLLLDSDRVDPRVVALADWINELWELLHG